MLISTRQLVDLDFDTFIIHDGETVSLYGKHPQADGSFLIDLEYADASGAKYSVQVDKRDMGEPMWDYDENDC